MVKLSTPTRWLIGLALAVATAVPSVAQEDTYDRKQLKAWKELCDRWAEAEGDGRKLLIEGEARKLPAIPHSAVEPLAEHLFELAAEHGPKLKKRGKNYFYDADKKLGLYLITPGKKGGGLLISLHGGGEGQGDAGSAHGIWSSAKSKGFTVISPEVMKKVSSAWNEKAEEQMVLEMIEAAKRTFEIDPDRICIAGHSMGGDGSWMIGGRNADLFAAASPLAGSVMPYMKRGVNNRLETPLSDYEGLMEGVIPNLMWLPYHIHHSDDDRNEAIHPDDIATGYLERLQKLYPERYVFTYDRVTGNGHALPTTGVKPIIEWMSEQRRKTYPDEVVWETWWPTKRQFYWLYHPAPEDAWRFHAKVVAPNHVAVTGTTKLVAGRTKPESLELTLLLSPEMFDFDKPLTVSCEGKTVFEGPIESSLWALLVSVGRRNDSKQWFQGHVDVEIPRKMWFDFWTQPEPLAPTTPSEGE